MNLAESAILPAPAWWDWRMPIAQAAVGCPKVGSAFVGRYCARPSPCADEIEAVLRAAGRPMVPAQVQQDLSVRVKSSAGTLLRQMFERGILDRRAVGNTHEYWIKKPGGSDEE